MANTPRSPKVRVDVTEEIITASIQKDSQHCMIAHSISAAHPDATHISVDLATIRFTDPKRGLRYTYLTPRIAQVQLVNFDQGRKPLPFSFLLRRGQVTRSGHRDTGKRPRKRLTTKQQQQRTEAGKKLNETLRRQKMVRGHGSERIAERVGGETPPLQKGKDNLPFTRRRAFGLRGLEF